MISHAPSRKAAGHERYARPASAVEFPEETLVPESQLHLDLRTLLYQLLKDHLGAAATVGSEQFVYFAADDPRQVVAPDAFVRRVPGGAPIRAWKTWERGAPELAVEIVSDSDDEEAEWERKLSRYRRLGVEELLRFDPREGAAPRLRVWDRVAEELVERRVEQERARSKVLAVTWVVAPAEGYAAALRIARDEAGVELVPTRAEARDAAEKRVAELEEELRRRGG